MNVQLQRPEPVGLARNEDDRDEQILVPLPIDMIAALRVAVFQRRSLGDETASLADLVQEAVSEWLDREIDDTASISIRI